MSTDSTPSAADGVSVVIPHYGDPSVTRRLVTQLLSESVAGGMQVIVSDDASPRPFPELSGVTVVRAAKNRGFGAAVNAGACQTSLPWLLVLNSDLEIAPGFIGELLEAAAPVQPAVCGVRQWDPNAERFAPAARRHHTVESMVLLRSGALGAFRDRPWWRRAARVVDVEAESSGAVDWLVGALMLMPREAFVAVGGFDERFFMYSEEADLQRRLALRGVPARLIAELAVTHVGGGSSGSLDVQLEQLRSQLIYIEKWDGPAVRRLLVAGLRVSVVVDLCVDSARRLTGRQVRPIEVARQRWRLITAARHPRGGGQG